MTCKKGGTADPSRYGARDDSVRWIGPAMKLQKREPRPELQEPTKLQIPRAAALVMTA
jgi:hypothetical protein